MSKKPDDAAKIAGLANILKIGNQQKEHPPSPAPAAETVVEAPAPEAPAPEATKPAMRRRLVGKRDDPNYHQCGLYIRKTTHKRAKRKLEDTRPGVDLSDLVQELLEQWLASQ
jgi:hypothetical protein